MQILEKKYSNKLFTAIIFWLVIYTNVFSQNPLYKHYTVNDGLPSSDVFFVLQDSKGYIWLATNYGVSRFDGYEFQKFDRSNGLIENSTLEIYEDYKGRIWFVNGGLNFCYYENGNIVEYWNNKAIDENIKEIPNITSLSFHVDSSDNVFVGVYLKGIYKISKNGEVSLNYPSIPYYSLYVENDNIWFNSESIIKQEVHVFEKRKEYVYDIPDADVKVSSGIRLCAIGKDKTIYFTDNNKLFKFTKPNNINSFCVENNSIISLNIDNDGNIWLGTKGNGVYCFEKDDISKFKYHFFEGKTITRAIVDIEGGIWFSTLNNGLYYVPSLNFYTFKDKVDETDAVESMVIDNDGNIFCLNNNKINQYDKSHNYIQTLSLKNGVEINCLSFINNKLWIGTSEQIYCYDKNGIRKIKLEGLGNIKEELLAFTTYCFLEGKENTIWVGTNKGIFKIENGLIKTYNQLPVQKSFKRVSSFAVFDSDKVIFGKGNNLYSFSEGNYIKYDSLTIPEGSRISHTNKSDFDSSLWFTTAGDGIIVMKNKKVYTITKKDGLNSNFIRNIDFSDNSVWVSSNNGLNKITISERDTFNYKITSFSISNGLLSNEVTQASAKNNIVYVATNKGLSYFLDDISNENKIPPPIYITNIKIIDTDVKIDSFFNLKWNENILTIDFKGLCFRKMGRGEYKYKMQGLNDDWETTKSTQVQYPYLPDGDYVFLVKALNESGVESSIPAKIHFHINPPFWKTWWFILIMIILVGLLTWLAFYLKMREVRKQSKLNQDLMNYRQQALSSQMNPHFIFNSLNSIQHFILQNDIRTSNKYLSKFSHLMRATLNNSQHTAIPLHDEINSLTLYLELESLRFKEKFEFSIEVDSSVNTLEIKIPTLLIQPYVENSIWHGLMHKEGQGKIRINIVKRENSLICVIEDNGIGREKAMEIKRNKIETHQSLGTKITEKRLELINSLYKQDMKIIYTDLTDSDGHANGTKVEISLPVIK